MAKKSKEKDDGYEFTMPDFDEKEYIRRERRKARTYFLSFAFGIVMGIICHFAWRGISPDYRWALTFLLAIASIGFLAKLLQLFKVDITQFGKKEWLGSIAFYFFTWLAIFIISINPPFYDASAPEIDSISVPAVQEVDSGIIIAAKVTDNVGVESVKINISDGIGWEEHPMAQDGLIYSYEYTRNGTGFYSYIISAEDNNGRQTTHAGNFTKARNLIMVDIPSMPMDAASEIKILARADILPDYLESDDTFLVYYVLEGIAVNATQSGEDIIDGKLYNVYTTTPNFFGWQEASHMQLSVFVRTTYYFVGVDNPVEYTINGGTYNVSTATDSDIGLTPSPQIKDLPDPRPLRQVPGFELAAIIVAVALILFVRRHR